MSLIKLAAYALFGYVLYELYLGISQGVEAQAKSSPAKTGGGSRGRSGSGQSHLRGSKPVMAEDARGGQMKHNVGRGVI